MKKTQTAIGASQQQNKSNNTASGIAARILLNLLLLAIALTLVAGAITQYLAHQFGYSPQLPGHINGIWYQPWSWVTWVWQYWPVYKPLMERAVFLFCGGSIAVLTLYAFGRMMIRRQSKGIDSLHGTAHWASREEIEEAGLLPKNKQAAVEGVYCGAWKDKQGKTHYLTHNGPEHVLVFAPTRSGKGVGLVLPTLLSWPHSCIVFDIKGENFALVSAWRKKYANNLIFKFDPTASDGSCARFNPLAEIRLGEDEEVKDAQNIAAMIADPDGKGLNDHWAKTSFALLTAMILHTCYAKRAEKKVACLADIDATLSDPERDIMTVLNDMLKYPHTAKGTHPLVAQEARAMLNKPENELGSVVSTTVSYLSLYRDPIVRENTSESHWSINDLMHHEQPASLFLVVPPSDADRLRPLIRLMLTMITKRLTEKMEFEGGRSVAHYKHRLLMMLDEFASLKRMTAIEDALSFAAGYGVKFELIIQDVEQINKPDMYGRENGIMGNCHVRIAYAPNKQETADVLSKMAGTTTIIKEAITESGKRHSWMLTSTSRTYSEHSRALITSDEVMRLPKPVTNAKGQIIEPGHMLIFVAGSAPIYGVQILYFLDSIFMARAKYASDHMPKQSDRVVDAIPAATQETTVKPVKDRKAEGQVVTGHLPMSRQPRQAEAINSTPKPTPTADDQAVSI